jgi:hypothetical protein
MESVLNGFCGATSWHHAISHVSAKSISAPLCSYVIVLVVGKRYSWIGALINKDWLVFITAIYHVKI